MASAMGGLSWLVEDKELPSIDPAYEGLRLAGRGLYEGRFPAPVVGVKVP